MEAERDLGNTYVPEEREWPEIEFSPFVSQKKHFVLCLDTMGQDREFTDNERRLVL